MSFDRRTFLLSGAATVLLGPHLGGADRAAAAAGGGTLVTVTLYGGNDWLNTVVPVADPRYAAARGALAVDPATALDLGEGLALHPALVGCKALWDERRLAVVQGVGFAGLDRSHFHCMDVWQAGDEHDLATGWLGRWLDLVGVSPLDAITVGRRLPLAVRGRRRTAAVVPVGPLALPGGDRLRGALTTMTGPGDDRAPLAALVASSTADLLAVIDDIAPLLAPTDDEPDEPDASADAAPAGAGDRADGLSGQLDVVARLIEAGVPARVYGVELGGFDTHAAQAATHESLLTELDGALSAFLARVGDRPVTVLVYSEFGRRVAANGSGGTDHARAGTVLLAGRVRPGFHGDRPSLDDLDGGDLRTTTDFRRVYGGLLEGVLGVPAADVLAGAPSPLRLV